MDETIKVALIGSRQYTNKRKIKDCIFDLVERFGDQLEIVSGEQPLGADGIAKKIALEFNIKYSSFPPSHFHYNQHCILPAYHYGKAYKPGNYFARNKQVAEYSTYFIAFIPKGVKTNEHWLVFTILYMDIIDLPSIFHMNCLCLRKGYVFPLCSSFS